MKTIAIVGGGFCGTITAVNLARLSDHPLRIVIINDRYPTGRGVAYSSKRPEHLLNVVARNMSALADDLTNFVEWLRTRHEYADAPDAQLRELFAPRRVYGDYLLSLLHAHARPQRNRSGSTIETIHAEAIDVSPTGGAVRVGLSDGQQILADKVLLATGNPPPSQVSVGGDTFSHPGFVNSWQLAADGLADRKKNVVLLGTGLTMVDAFLTLDSLDWQGTIVAISRNGLLPQSHFQGVDYPDFPPADPSSMGLVALVTLIEEHCTRLAQRGLNPALLVDKLRPHTQLIWRRFSAAERQQFLKQYKSTWNVHRHRIAQTIHQRLTQGLADGRLKIERGTVCRLACRGESIGVVVQNSEGAERTIEGQIVLNCMGPQERFSTINSPLLQKMLADGCIALDELDMGLRVTAEFAVIDRQGHPSSQVYAIGPPLKGTLWETTAVPELRVQTYQVAHILAGIPLRLDRPDPSWPAQTGMELLEYCI